MGFLFTESEKAREFQIWKRKGQEYDLGFSKSGMLFRHPYGYAKLAGGYKKLKFKRDLKLNYKFENCQHIYHIYIHITETR